MIPFHLKWAFERLVSSVKQAPLDRRQVGVAETSVSPGQHFVPRLEILEDRSLPSVSFAAGVTFAVGGSAPQSAAVADVNGDGKPDIIVTATYGASTPSF